MWFRVKPLRRLSGKNVIPWTSLRKVDEISSIVEMSLRTATT